MVLVEYWFAWRSLRGASTLLTFALLWILCLWPDCPNPVGVTLRVICLWSTSPKSDMQLLLVWWTEYPLSWSHKWEQMCCPSWGEHGDSSYPLRKPVQQTCLQSAPVHWYVPAVLPETTGPLFALPCIQPPSLSGRHPSLSQGLVVAGQCLCRSMPLDFLTTSEVRSLTPCSGRRSGWTIWNASGLYFQLLQVSVPYRGWKNCWSSCCHFPQQLGQLTDCGLWLFLQALAHLYYVVDLLLGKQELHQIWIH